MYNIIEEPDWRSGEEREQVQAEMEREKCWKKENGKREVLGETESGRREGRREGFGETENGGRELRREVLEELESGKREGRRERRRETEREKRSISADVEEAAAAMEDNSVTRKIFPM